MDLYKALKFRHQIVLLMVFGLAGALFILAATSPGYSVVEQNMVACLDQSPPGTSPKVFAPGTVSTPANEFGCAITPDGKEFYFGRRDPQEDRNVIMVSKCVNGTWTKPEVVSSIQDREAFEPMVSLDGRRLYHMSDRPVPGLEGPPMNVWFLEREKDRWGRPQNPGPFINPGKAMFISMTLAGEIYTTDISGGPGSEGIAVAKMVDGKYQGLQRLGPPINVGAQDMYPHVAPDESYLIFASKRTVQGTSSGLFVSFRKPDGNWGEPRIIDLGLSASLPRMSPEGKYLFFTAGERLKGDIYWVEAKFLSGK